MGELTKTAAEQLWQKQYDELLALLSSSRVELEASGTEQHLMWFRDMFLAAADAVLQVQSVPSMHYSARPRYYQVMAAIEHISQPEERFKQMPPTLVVQWRLIVVCSECQEDLPGVGFLHRGNSIGFDDLFLSIGHHEVDVHKNVEGANDADGSGEGISPEDAGSDAAAADRAAGNGAAGVQHSS